MIRCLSFAIKMKVKAVILLCFIAVLSIVRGQLSELTRKLDTNYDKRISGGGLRPFLPRRGARASFAPHKVVDAREDCMMVTSEEGEIFYKSSWTEDTVCGIYMVATPNHRIELIFNYFDVPCDAGGLVAWIDGWELSGETFPAAAAVDDERVHEWCGIRAPRRRFLSSQNVALVQYRVPVQGKGFAVTVRHVFNPEPCDVLLYGVNGIHSLHNQGRAGNCSLACVAPAVLRVLALDVGVVGNHERGAMRLQTGTVNKCQKRGLDDYALIGGSTGLDDSRMVPVDSVCGADINPVDVVYRIACETTTVKLISSGHYKNSITVSFDPLPLDMMLDADIICGL